MTKFIEGGDQTTRENDSSESVVEKLVGEGKKFKDIEELAKGKMESDAFIQKIQDENKGLLEELETLRSKANSNEDIRNVIEELRGAVKQGRSDDGKPPLSEGDLAATVEKILEGREAKQTRNANREQARKLVLQKTNGDVDAANTFVAERAKANEMTVEQMLELSETSPKAFAKLMDVQLKTQDPNLASIPNEGSNANLKGDRPTHIDGVPTKAYFDELRRKMGVTKFIQDRKVQREYMDAATKLGLEKFNV